MTVDIVQNVGSCPATTLHNVSIRQSISMKSRNTVMTSRMEVVDIFNADALLHASEVVADLVRFIFCNVALVARGIPCGKDYYYDRYRKFFWLLDKER